MWPVCMMTTCFFGLIVSKHEEEHNIKIKFLHSNGPAPSFYRSQNNNECQVLLDNIIYKMETPTFLLLS